MGSDFEEKRKSYQKALARVTQIEREMDRQSERYLEEQRKKREMFKMFYRNGRWIFI